MYVFILATLGSWWRMWVVIWVTHYHSHWDITHLVKVKLHTFTLANGTLSNYSQMAATGTEPCHSMPLPSPQRRLRVSQARNLLLSIHPPECCFFVLSFHYHLSQAPLEALGRLQGTLQTTILLSQDFYFIRQRESIHKK